MQRCHGALQRTTIRSRMLSGCARASLPSRRTAAGGGRRRRGGGHHDLDAAHHAHPFLALLNNCAARSDGGASSASASAAAAATAMSIHAEIARSEYLHLALSPALVAAYARCGSLFRAQDVFEQLNARDSALWNALMEAHLKRGQCEKTLGCCERMQAEVVHPDAVSYVLGLKACAAVGTRDKGRKLHVEIQGKGFLRNNVFIGSSLIDMYAKCGSLPEAQEVFEHLTCRNVVTWTALIAGFVLHGQGKEALRVYHEMQSDGVTPNVVTYICALKACSSIRAIEKGQEIHAHIERHGLLETDLAVGNTLIDMYAKFGLLPKARKVFDELPSRNIVSWTALIAGYTEHGYGDEALECFAEMQGKGFSPNAATFICGLRACGSTGAIGRGHEIHAEIERRGLLDAGPSLGNSLIDMYAKCGSLSKAQEVFDHLPARDIVSWNSLLAGYAEHDHGEEVLIYFDKMQDGCVSPDAVTFVCSLKACGSSGAIEKGQEIHAEVERQGLLERNPFISSTLVDMYAKCGLVGKASEIFNKLPARDVISWNAIIVGCANYGFGEQALKYYGLMQAEGISPDMVTFLSVLKACAYVKEKGKGAEIHEQVERRGWLGKDILLGSTLVDMYAKCGWVTKAQHVFDQLQVRDVVLWNALIGGYVEHGHAEEALKVFNVMHLEGIAPDASTYVCSLKACGSLGAASKGQKIHADIAAKWCLGADIVIDNTLVDMYVKCGLLSVAQKMFDKLSVRDVVSWNSLISGYAQHGQSGNVFHMFERMLGNGVRPDLVSFAIILHACSRMGLLNLSQTYFDVMSKDYGIIPTIDHHTSMVDLLGRVGQLDKAVIMINKSAVSNHTAIWRRVLEACRNWGNMELGKRTFEHAVHLVQNSDSAFDHGCV